MVQPLISVRNCTSVAFLAGAADTAGSPIGAVPPLALAAAAMQQPGARARRSTEKWAMGFYTSLLRLKNQNLRVCNDWDARGHKSH